MFILPIVRPASRDRDANEQDDQEKSDEDDPEHGHLYFPVRSNGRDARQTNAAAEGPMNPGPPICGAREINAPAVAHIIASSRTSPAMPRRRAEPGHGHSVARSRSLPLGTLACATDRIRCYATSVWTEVSNDKHHISSLLEPGVIEPVEPNRACFRVGATPTVPIRLRWIIHHRV